MSEFSYNIPQAKQYPHHPAMTQLVDMLCHRTGNMNRDFFQAEVAYFLGLVPSTMRCSIESPERGVIPVNIYSIGLATSGFGKGHSVSLLEDVLSGFRTQYAESVFPAVSDTHLYDMAVHIAATKGSNEDEEKVALDAEFKRCGTAPFIFDSGTSPAVKQLRQKLLLSGIGAINFQMDEIGSNLPANAEVLNVLLELYDLGRIKTKLVKNTAENERGMDIVGETPANVLMFGTTSKLFDGARVEDEFFSFLETGYARRCFFGIGKPENVVMTQDPADVYRSLISKDRSASLGYWKKYITKFADPQYLNTKLAVPEEVGIELVQYRLHCEALAQEMPEHEAIRKAEMSHRYFKVLKMAGVYAFLDESPEIKAENLRQAIRLAEESGDSFQGLLQRERNFARLAKYVADKESEVTHADLVEDLPYYPSSTGPRKEIMDLAMAWGVRNRVVIKKNVISGVEFFSGSSLQETDLNKLTFSLSDNYATDYDSFTQPLDKIPNMLAAPGMHWCNHRFEGEHRSEDNVIPGFNMLVVDMDGGEQVAAVHEMLKEYTFITSTTKRHSDDVNRFRLIMPMNYVLALDKPDYKEFMNSFLLWLPFESDPAANQRSKKWLTNEGSQIHINRGTSMIDVLPFIPKTKLNEEYVKEIKDLGQLDNLERWFLNEMEIGNRNNQILNFAMMLKDGGISYAEARSKVLNLNSRTSSPLKKSELEDTVLKTLASKYN